MLSESIVYFLTLTPAESWYGPNLWPNTFNTCVQYTHTRKVNLILSKCYFKAFPSTPSKHDFQHLNKVFLITELKNRANNSRREASFSEVHQPLRDHHHHGLKKGLEDKGNLSPVKLVSDMLSALPGSWASSLLASLPFAYEPGESKALFGNPSWQIVNTQNRASDLIFLAGYTLH